MFKTRWMKLFRDIWVTRGRVTMMAVAISISLFGIGAILSAYAILGREISRNYLSTNPASATLEVPDLNDNLIEHVRSWPDIGSVEARASVLARLQVRSGVWQPLLLFVVKDFDAMKVATFKPEKGAWPPPEGTMLLERAALEMNKIRIGETIQIKTPNGPRHSIAVSGSAHDPSLAPAWQERMSYGYITPGTMKWLGESGVLDEIKITFNSNPYDMESVSQRTLSLAAWITAQGYKVHDIQVPPPGKHPHQNQMMAILMLLFIFSLFALFLSGILAATIISGIMNKEVRQIGVMKAVGANTPQITGIYASLILIISIAAIAFAIPFSAMAGKGLAAAVSSLLNFTLYSSDIPGWVFLVQIAAGIILPLLLTLIPIINISKMSVREAISSYGVSRESFPNRRPNPLMVLLGRFDRTLLLTIRNTFRRQSRLLLTLGLLSAGGAMFMSALNVNSAWKQNLTGSFDARHYDFEIRLNHMEPSDRITRLISVIPGVKSVEPWGYMPASRTMGSGLVITRTYPDGGHGSLSLRGLPDNSKLVTFPVLKGRWVNPQDTGTVVLNQFGWSQFSNINVGEFISFSANGHPASLRLIGVVREIGPASAYVNSRTFDNIIEQAGVTESIRVVTQEKSLEKREEVLQRIEKSLSDAGISVSLVLADAELRNAITEHIFILIISLIGMAILMGVVGLLGLASTISTNVTERTREFGVMRSVGATPALILRNIVGESVFTGLLSLLGSIVFSLPLSIVVGRILGNMAFKTPLPLVFSPHGFWIWLWIVILGSILSSAYPAWRASRMSIRETLVYE